MHRELTIWKVIYFLNGTRASLRCCALGFTFFFPSSLPMVQSRPQYFLLDHTYRRLFYHLSHQQCSFYVFSILKWSVFWLAELRSASP